MMLVTYDARGNIRPYERELLHCIKIDRRNALHKLHVYLGREAVRTWQASGQPMT